MNIDDDDLSDDYDFVDSDNEAAQARRSAAKQAQIPRKKYMDILQRVANRLEDEIIIDLDDVAEVSRFLIERNSANLFCIVRTSP